MASNPFFSGRIPQSLLDSIEAHRKETGESKTEVLTKALARYVGCELDEEKPSIPPIQEKLDEIFSRLENLEKQVITLDNKDQQITQQLEIPADNSKITGDNSITTEQNNIAKHGNDNNAITFDNELRMISVKELIELIGVSRSTLSFWKKRKKLPQKKEGYIIDYDYENSKPRNGIWIVKKDNDLAT